MCKTGVARPTAALVIGNYRRLRPKVRGTLARLLGRHLDIAITIPKTKTTATKPREQHIRRYVIFILRSTSI